MRIALITESFLPNVNGVTTTLCRMLEYIQDAGHQAMVFAPRGAPTHYAGADVVPLDGVPLPFYPEVHFTPPQFGLTEQLRRFQPDLIHMATPVVLGTAIPVLVQNVRVPLISSYHTDLVAYSEHYGLGVFKAPLTAYLRWVYNHSRMTLCPSRATLNELRAQGFRRLKVWGRGVDTTSFHPNFRSNAWRESIGSHPDETILIYVGRISKEKRVDLLEEAIHGLEGVRLVMVGDGPARADMEQRMQGLPVHFTGYLKGQALATAYASSDLFVFSSDTDTFGQVIQEAMASSLPVVAARAGGAPDLVQEGVTGALFAPGSATDLRVKLRNLVANREQRVAFGRAGRAVAETRSWHSVMQELMGHYEHLLRRTPWTRDVPSFSLGSW